MLKKLLLALALVFTGAAFTPPAEAAPFTPGAAGVERAAAPVVDGAQYYYRYRYRPRRYFVRRVYRPRYFVPRRYVVRRVYRPVYRYRRFY